MTPIFTGDSLQNAEAIKPPLEKGIYTFEIGTITTFNRLKKDTNEEVYGLNVPLKVSEGYKKGESTFLQLYFHTAGAIGMAKRFAMAAMGYKGDAPGERAYNKHLAALSEEDKVIDFEHKEVTGMWKELIGSTVVGDVDIRMNEQNGEAQQNFRRWIPYGEAQQNAQST